MSDIDKTLQRVAIVVGWCTALIIIVATLAPIESRPHLAVASPDIEHFGAFVLLSCALATAYPRHRGWVLLLTTGLAIGLEAGQLLEATRHGRPHDAVVKIVGGIVGIVLASVLTRIRRRMITVS